MDKKESITKDSGINREIMPLMKWAISYSSRGMGFALAVLGVLVQGAHMFLAFTIVNPFENVVASFLISLLGAMFLSGALLYYVGRSSEDNVSAIYSVKMFTYLEIGLGLIFYLDKLIYKPLVEDNVGFYELNFPAILMGGILAIFIPIAIKGYATQVRALEPVIGEKHNLSKSDMLMISGDIDKMIDTRLRGYTLDYEAQENEIEKLYGIIENMNNSMYIFIGDEIDRLENRVYDLVDDLADTKMTAMDSYMLAQQALDDVQIGVINTESDIPISEGLINDIERIMFAYEMMLEQNMDTKSVDKIKEMARTFNVQAIAQEKMLYEHTKQLAKVLESKSERMTTEVQERALAKTKSDVGVYVEDMVAGLVDKEDIIKNVMHKIQKQDLDNHEIGRLKNTMMHIKENVRNNDSAIKSLDKQSVKEGEKQMVTFYTKKGEKEFVMRHNGRDKDGDGVGDSIMIGDE